MAKKLEELRIARGWTQAELAKKAGLDQSAISRIETTGRRGHPSTMRNLATALNVEVFEIEESGHKAPKKENRQSLMTANNAILAA